jgi:hypothetical protein
MRASSLLGSQNKMRFQFISEFLAVGKEDRPRAYIVFERGDPVAFSQEIRSDLKA